MFASQEALHLRLFCTHGMSLAVSRALDCWPTIPISVMYGGSPALDPPGLEDDDDIVAALKRPDRVRSIHLTLTRSLLTKVSSIDSTFSELQELVLLSLDDVQLTLPSTFRWGPHLRTLHATRVGIPALPQLLSSSKDLVDIQLQEIPGIGYFSPKSFRNSLSGISRLRSLSLHFLSAVDYVGVVHPPSGERVLLPALTHLKYCGASEYLDSLVARVDAPLLCNIEITFFDEFLFDVCNLSELIDRMDRTRSCRQAEIVFADHSVSISLTQPTPTCLKLEVVSEPLLRRQLFSLVQICRRFSAFLWRVEDLSFRDIRSPTKHDGAVQWRDLIRLFRGTKWLRVIGNFSTDIVLALHQPSRRGGETFLPAMHKLCIQEPEPHCAPSSLRMAVESLMNSRRLLGHFIGVEYERLWADEPREIGIIICDFY